METQHDAAMRESPEERAIDEARVTIERAERVWRQQVKGEEASLPTAPYVGLRGLFAGRLPGRDHLVLFPRLGQLG